MEALDGPAAEFLREWRRITGADTPGADEIFPMGHVMRYRCQSNWTRFHALPRSKRYADTPDEMEIILSRANALLRACFGEFDSWPMCTSRHEPRGD